MPRLSASILALTLALAGPAALASGSSAPFGYAPDPVMLTESPKDLESRVRRTCASTQARLQSTSSDAVARPCSCYARAVMRSLDANEVAAYRTTGLFNETARGKAVSALDACKLQRPA